MKIILTLIWLFMASMAHAETSNEVLAYESRGPRGEVINLKAEIRLPKGGTPPFKLIVLQHSSGPNVPLTTFRGQTDSVAAVVGEMAVRRNYAVVYTDSFTPRGMRESHRIDSEEIGSREISRDLIALMREIHRDARFDKENLFFFGHSLGGALGRDVSHPDTWERVRWLGGRQTPFRAVVSSAPGCHLNREGLPGQPLMIIVGAEDDWTPAKPCAVYIDSLKVLGAKDLELELIAGVGHTYSTTGTSWNARAISFRGCVDNPVTFKRGGRFIQGGVEISFDDYKRRCHTQGATSRGPEDKAPLVASKALEFFERFQTR